MGIAVVGVVEEELHNRAVLAYAKTFGDEYEVHVNLGDEQIYPLKGYYPDIVAVHKLSGEVHVAEVKTKTLIIPSQVICQWEPFSHLGDNFTLLVPRGHEEETTLLTHGVKVDRLVSYFEEADSPMKFEEVQSVNS